jgi:precorrin-6B methylase 2
MVVGGVAVGAAPVSIAAGPLLTVVATVASTHFQTDGQSASEVQLATLAWQEPGKDEVVMHTGAGAGSPFADGADPEHVPMVVG